MRKCNIFHQESYLKEIWDKMFYLSWNKGNNYVLSYKSNDYHSALPICISICKSQCRIEPNDLF